MDKTSLWDDIFIDDKSAVEENIKEPNPVREPTNNSYTDKSESKYVVLAYINKRTGKQMYLSGWDDSSDWMISTVPYETTKARCEMLVNKAMKQIEKAKEASTIRSRFPDDLKFEIVEVQ